MAESKKKAESKGPSPDDDKSNALGPDAPEDQDDAKLQEENAEAAGDPTDDDYDPFNDPDLNSVLAQIVAAELEGSKKGKSKKGKSPTLEAVKQAKKEAKEASE